MSYNLVVLTDDLGKLTYADDALDFDGVGDYLNGTLNHNYSGTSTISGKFVIGAETPDTLTGRVYRVDNTITIVYNVATGDLGVFVYDFNNAWQGGWNLWNHQENEGVSIAVTFSVNGSDIEMTMNGSVYNTTQPLFSNFLGSNILEIGADMSLIQRFKGTISDFVLYSDSSFLNIVCHYIKNGDFGGAIIDHTGLSSNLTNNGATWWKMKFGQPVDQVFANATLYNNQLPVTPVEFQKVIDIGTGAPATNDAFWGDYDDEWLTVTVQTNLAKYNMKSNSFSNRLALEN